MYLCILFYISDRKLISGGTFPTKVSSSEGKECKMYINELQRYLLNILAVIRDYGDTFEGFWQK